MPRKKQTEAQTLSPIDQIKSNFNYFIHISKELKELNTLVALGRDLCDDPDEYALPRLACILKLIEYELSLFYDELRSKSSRSSAMIKSGLVTEEDTKPYELVSNWLSKK